MQMIQNSQTILGKNKIGKLTLSDLKIDYKKAKIIKTVWYRHKEIDGRELLVLK